MNATGQSRPAGAHLDVDVSVSPVFGGRRALWLAPTLALVVGLAVSGCGGSGGPADGGGNVGGVASCTVVVSEGTQTVNTICYEGTGAALRIALQQQCSVGADAGGGGPGATSAGHFAQAPCSHVGAIGGCLSTVAGMSQTGWYYAVSGITAEMVQQLCAGIGATFVAP